MTAEKLFLQFLFDSLAFPLPLRDFGEEANAAYS